MLRSINPLCPQKTMMRLEPLAPIAEAVLLVLGPYVAINKTRPTRTLWYKFRKRVSANMQFIACKTNAIPKSVFRVIRCPAPKNLATGIVKIETSLFV